MKRFMAITGVVAALAGCANGKIHGAVGIDEPEILKGGHCESSALMNALAALGYRFTEAEIVGFGSAPSFVYLRQGFPFIGGRSADLRERLFETVGIDYRVVVPAKGEDRWAGIAELLRNGIPVPLRVDMRWLPYLYGGKYGPSYMSFGWHYVCLFKIDFDEGMAWVSDTGNEGLQAIKLADLEKARFSATKSWPPRGEYVALEKAPAGWSFDRKAATFASIEGVVRNYRESGFEDGGASALVALEAFPDALRDIGKDVNRFALPAAYAYMAATIETNGTGGSLFRKFWRDFLDAASIDDTASIDDAASVGNSAFADPLRTAVRAADKAAAAWSGLAREFDGAAITLKEKNDDANRAAVASKTATTAETVVTAERELLAALEAAVGDMKRR